jgi:hypothetical protein
MSQHGRAAAALGEAPGRERAPGDGLGSPGRVVTGSRGKLVRVGVDAARLLDASRQHPGADDVALAALLGPPWDAALVSATMDRFERLGTAGPAGWSRAAR